MNSFDHCGHVLPAEIEPSAAKCVLLIENNPEESMAARMALQQLKLKNPVHRVGTAEGAIAYIEGRGMYQDRDLFSYPAVIVLTLHLPNLDSTRVQYWVRSSMLHRKMPIVVISRKEDLNALKAAVQFGASAYMTKPFSPLEFDCLSRVLRLPLEFGDAN